MRKLQYKTPQEMLASHDNKFNYDLYLLLYHSEMFFINISNFNF